MDSELETLPQLITRRLRDLDTDRAHLAAAIGVTTSTLSRWGNRMPSRELVHALAAELDLPLGIVLAAALRSGGYAHTLNDVLAGHTVTMVARDADALNIDDENHATPGGVFTDPTNADTWAALREELDIPQSGYGRGEITTATVVIDGAATPTHVTVYRARWDHSTDTITVSSSNHATTPESLRTGTRSAHVEALRESQKAYAVSAHSLDEAEARQIVAATVSELRAADKILPMDQSTGLTFTDHLVHQSMRPVWLPRRAEEESAETTADTGPKLPVPDREELLLRLRTPLNAEVPYVWGGGNRDQDMPADAPRSDPIVSFTMTPGS